MHDFGCRCWADLSGLLAPGNLIEVLPSAAAWDLQVVQEGGSAARHTLAHCLLQLLLLLLPLLRPAVACLLLLLLYRLPPILNVKQGWSPPAVALLLLLDLNTRHTAAVAACWEVAASAAVAAVHNQHRDYC